jgi:hypothetical protein
MSLRLVRLVACLLVMAASIFCADRSLFADTCGDYLQHRSNPNDASATPFIHSDGKRIEFHVGLIGDQSKPRAPCNGPRCSQAPNRPVNVPDAVPQIGPQERNTAAILGATTEADEKSSYWFALPNSLYACQGSEDIFHPPRVS